MTAVLKGARISVKCVKPNHTSNSPKYTPNSPQNLLKLPLALIDNIEYKYYHDRDSDM